MDARKTFFINNLLPDFRLCRTAHPGLNHKTAALQKNSEAPLVKDKINFGYSCFKN